MALKISARQAQALHLALRSDTGIHHSAAAVAAEFQIAPSSGRRILENALRVATQSALMSGVISERKQGTLHNERFREYLKEQLTDTTPITPIRGPNGHIEYMTPEDVITTWRQLEGAEDMIVGLSKNGRLPSQSEIRWALRNRGVELPQKTIKLLYEDLAAKGRVDKTRPNSVRITYTLSESEKSSKSA